MRPEKFTANDYNAMASELEAMAELIHQHPEVNHNTSERLKKLADEMRQDAQSPYLMSAGTSRTTIVPTRLNGSGRNSD